MNVCAPCGLSRRMALRNVSRYRFSSSVLMVVNRLVKTLLMFLSTLCNATSTPWRDVWSRKPCKPRISGETTKSQANENVFRSVNKLLKERIKAVSSFFFFFFFFTIINASLHTLILTPNPNFTGNLLRWTWGVKRRKKDQYQYQKPMSPEASQKAVHISRQSLHSHFKT